jgi:capsular exopolysaccharide synthesis family protein
MKIFHRNKKEDSKTKRSKIKNSKMKNSKTKDDSEEMMLSNEAYKTLRTNIQFCQANTEIKTLVITSSCPNEGKSTTAFNLANTFGESGKKVLIIDCDLRRPTLHKLYKLSNDKGLTNVLAAQIDITEVLNESSFPGVDFIACGTIPPNPSELLNSSRMEFYLKRAKHLYDYIILDTPPISIVTDAQILAGKCDGTFLVIASGQVDKKKILESKALLDKVGANILGSILTKAKVEKSEYGQYYQQSKVNNSL